jgi:hypothetical protein
VIPLPLRSSFVRLHGLRIRRPCTAVKIDSGIALGVGSPSPPAPRRVPPKQWIWRALGRLSGGCPPQSVVLVR